MALQTTQVFRKTWNIEAFPFAHKTVCHSAPGILSLKFALQQSKVRNTTAPKVRPIPAQGNALGMRPGWPFQGLKARSMLQTQDSCNESCFDSRREAVYHPVLPMTSPAQPIRWPRIAAAAVLAVVFAGTEARPIYAQSAPHERRHDAKQQVEALEEQWRKAQIAGDTTAMDKMLSDDYVGISIMGEVDTKAQALSRTAEHRLMLTKIELSDMKVKLIGAIAIVTSRAQVEGINDGVPVKGMYRYTRIYQYLPSGQWKVTSFEATREHGTSRHGNGQRNNSAAGIQQNPKQD